MTFYTLHTTPENEAVIAQLAGKIKAGELIDEGNAIGDKVRELLELADAEQGYIDLIVERVRFDAQYIIGQ